MWSWNQCVLIVSCQSPGIVDEPAAAVGRARHAIGGAGVDAEVPGEHDRPVVVVELVREEERAGEAVVLRAVVAVVLVRRDGVAAEAAVLP